VGPPPLTIPPIPTIDNGIVIPEPELMLKTCSYRGKLQVLIKWKHQPPAQSSWEDAELFQQLYPKF
jgi:hypothetical protein